MFWPTTSPSKEAVLKEMEAAPFSSTSTTCAAPPLTEKETDVAVASMGSTAVAVMASPYVTLSASADS